MRRRRFIIAGSLAVLPLRTLAQKKATLHRVGLIWLGGGQASSLSHALIGGLRERGYVNGRNIELLDRTQLTRYEQLADAAKELVQAKVDVIVSFGAEAPRAMRAATSTIPIVVVGSDPVGAGLAKSLSRPGANVTGIATLSSDLLGKRFELLRECVPGSGPIAVLFNPTSDASVRMLPTVEAEAQRLKLKLQVVEARTSADLEQAFARAAKANPAALYVVPNTMFNAHRRQIASLAIEYRLAAVGSTPEYVDAGLLLAYSANLEEMFRRAAGYVARILKGEKPAEMAIEQASEFELAINMKTAKALGIKIPEALRFRATKLVE
jgi:putative ABC transport system substrate-binding protein